MRNKVLLVEPNVEIRENLGELLELNGFEVVNATNGLFGCEAALHLLPEIILCDIMLPGGDRELFLRVVREHEVLSRIPLILFSADISSPEVQPSRGREAEVILQKPFTGEELLGAISDSLAGSRYENSYPKE